MFRIRKCAEGFAGEWKVPFTVGRYTPWQPVEYTVEKRGDTVTVKSEKLTIHVRENRPKGEDFIVCKNGRERIYPVDAPRFGMFINKCIVFDSASFPKEVLCAQIL